MHLNRINRPGILICILLILLPAFSYADLILGVHPYIDAESIKKRFAPLAQYLSVNLGTNIEVRVGKDYESHIETIGHDNIDIAFMGPASYVGLTQKYGKKPLLARLEANGKPSFSGHIIVRKESPLQKIEDLKNTFFAFGDKNSTMSTLVPQSVLQKQGIGLDDLAGYRHFKGHKNVAIAVLAGDADAGAVKEEILTQYESRGLRSLIKLPDISEHLFVTSSDLHPALINKIRGLLLAINQPTQIKGLLQPIKKKITGLVEVKDSDYDSLRELIGTD
ncbi:MAG: phosphate/phosphite/phosphonate ABC transporter substrate-binding protein [Gammaproteobacteria bacterium]|jgi:phosphonate transport system substrate-binding protein